MAGPVVALTNEHAGSDGDIFSHNFKLMGLGPLVGTRTWGGVIGIWPRHTLVDGTQTTQPEFSFWFSDVGFGVENYGTDPQIEVDNAPQDARDGPRPPARDVARNRAGPDREDQAGRAGVRRAAGAGAKAVAGAQALRIGSDPFRGLAPFPQRIVVSCPYQGLTTISLDERTAIAKVFGQNRESFRVLVVYDIRWFGRSLCLLRRRAARQGISATHGHGPSASRSFHDYIDVALSPSTTAELVRGALDCAGMDRS